MKIRDGKTTLLTKALAKLLLELVQQKHLNHRLVAQVFLPNYYGKSFVNHKDHDKANCKLYNLEWVTPHENAIAAVKHYSKLKK